MSPAITPHPPLQPTAVVGKTWCQHKMLICTFVCLYMDLPYYNSIAKLGRAWPAHAVTCPSLQVYCAVTALTYWGCTAYARCYICMCSVLHVATVHQRQKGHASSPHVQCAASASATNGTCACATEVHLHMQHSDICIQPVYPAASAIL